MEKAKMLEKKENQLKYEEEGKIKEELRKKREDQKKKEESEEKIRQARELKEQENLAAENKKRLQEDILKKEAEQKKRELLAKEKKLREEAEKRRKEELKKTEIRKHILKEKIANDEQPYVQVDNKLEPVEIVEESNGKESHINMHEREVLNQPSKLKSPVRKPSKDLKQSEAEMREKKKREMMEAKIEKRRLMVEQSIQKTELVRKQARVQMEKFENDKMEKNLRKSIKSAELSLESHSNLHLSKTTTLEESNEETKLQNNATDDSKSLEINQKDVEIQEVPVNDPSPQIKKKTIRIGRRPAKKTAATEETESNLKVHESSEVPPSVIGPTMNENQDEDTNILKLPGNTTAKAINKTKDDNEESSGDSSNSEDLGSFVVPKGNTSEEISAQDESSTNITISESVLYPAPPIRKSSRGRKSLAETETAQSITSRTSKRKPAAKSMKEESPSKKGKTILVETILEKPKRGKKKKVPAVLDVAHESPAGEEVENEEVTTAVPVETEPVVTKSNSIVLSEMEVKNPRNQTYRSSINPPIVHDESSLQNKLERRRKRIEDTISNPETAISASKIVRRAKTPEKPTSLAKKLSKQRQIVEETPQESQNPSPIKNLTKVADY